MTRLKQNLYLTFSNQKARELKRSGELRAFDEVTTLSTLIQETFEKHHFETIIDDVLGSSIVHYIIKNEPIDYFSYLKSGDDSLSTIFDFIVKCHRNGVSFDVLLDGEKIEAVMQIDEAYRLFKKEHNLVDVADVERTVVEEWDNRTFDNYESVYIDRFEVGEISFIESKYQVMLLEKLREYPAFESVKEKHSTATLVKPSQEVFDAIDEVKTALKIVRKLLQKEEAEEILIVASDIEEYAPLYKLFLDEYGLQGYSSAGTSLSAFHNNAHPKVRQSLQTYEKEMAALSLRYEKMGLALTQTLKEQLKASVKIADEKIGIEMTEPNQLVGLNRRYKHIIFIGTDINHFPPQAQDNFLYSYEDALQHFHANDYFASSKTQYDELKRLGDKLYIITARYSDKRKLEPSIVIDKEIKKRIDVGDIQGLSDLALTGQTVMPDAHTKAYYESIESETLTAFDGLGVEGVKANHLSASQINKYLACPLAYLFNSKLKLQAPDTTEEGFDVMQQGSLMHLCYELFGKAIRDTQNQSTDIVELYDLMYDVSLKAYVHPDTLEARKNGENIHHKIFLSTLQAGLKDEREAGLLTKFVDYYIEHAQELNYFQNTAFEKEFLLDAELKPYERKYEEDYDYFIRGFIDRLDNLPDRVNVIDYKSKKMAGKTDKKKMEQVETLKDVQLALYLLYVKSVYPDKEYYAHLLSFKGDNPYYHFANLSSIEEKNSVLFDEAYEERLKAVVFETKSNIKAGNFGFDNSDEEACGWCDYRRICHQEVLEKGR